MAAAAGAGLGLAALTDSTLFASLSPSSPNSSPSHSLAILKRSRWCSVRGWPAVALILLVRVQLGQYDLAGLHRDHLLLF